jgi:hypothetical protein
MIRCFFARFLRGVDVGSPGRTERARHADPRQQRLAVSLDDQHQRLIAIPARRARASTAS